MRRILPSLIVLVLLGSPLQLSAASEAANACKNQITSRVLQQQRVFRAVLFGRNAASLELEGALRYDATGTPWIKLSANRWVTDTGRTQTDGGIDSTTEWEGMNDPNPLGALRQARTGILQTKGALTSDLLPAVLESYRALRCRLAMVCAGIPARIITATQIDVTTPGCAPLKMAPLNLCQFANADQTPQASAFPTVNPADDSDIREVCTPLIERIAKDEERMITLAVSYNAAVRSLLQFSGQFDTFLEAWRGDVLSPLRQTVSLVQQLSRIPCFLSQCTNE